MRKETLVPVDLLDVLLDPDNHDPIRCVAEDGTMIEFEQVGVISLPAENDKTLYCILHPVTEGKSDLAYPFRVILSNGRATLSAVDDPDEFARIKAKYEALQRGCS